MVPLLRPLERVLGEVFVVCGPAAKLRDCGQLKHCHRLLQDAHSLLVDLLLLGLAAGVEAGDRRAAAARGAVAVAVALSGVAAMGGAVVFVAPEAESGKKCYK